MEFRYVGQDRLPARLSDFDVERYFALTATLPQSTRAVGVIAVPALPSNWSFYEPVAIHSIMSAHCRARYYATLAIGSVDPRRLSPPFAHFTNATRRSTSIRSGVANISA